MGSDIVGGATWPETSARNHATMHVEHATTPHFEPYPASFEDFERHCEKLKDARDNLIKLRLSILGVRATCDQQSILEARASYSQLEGALRTLKLWMDCNGHLPTTFREYVRQSVHMGKINTWRQKLEELEMEYDDAERKYRSKERFCQQTHDSLLLAHDRHHVPSITTATYHNFELPGFIGKTSVVAVGHFCAKHSFMNEAKAIGSGLMIDRQSMSRILVGSGNTILSMGTVTTPFRFKNEREFYSLIFRLIPGCIKDVVLGKPFLKGTKTFSSLVNLPRQVVKRPITGVTPRHFLYLGEAFFVAYPMGISRKPLRTLAARYCLWMKTMPNRLGFLSPEVTRTKRDCSLRKTRQP